MVALFDLLINFRNFAVIMRKLVTILIITLGVFINSYAKDSTIIAPSYAWQLIEPLGLHKESTIDTLLYNYQHNSIHPVSLQRMLPPAILVLKE